VKGPSRRDAVAHVDRRARYPAGRRARARACRLCGLSLSSPSGHGCRPRAGLADRGFRGRASGSSVRAFFVEQTSWDVTSANHAFETRPGGVFVAEGAKPADAEQVVVGRSVSAGSLPPGRASASRCESERAALEVDRGVSRLGSFRVKALHRRVRARSASSPATARHRAGKRRVLFRCGIEGRVVSRGRVGGELVFPASIEIWVGGGHTASSAFCKCIGVAPRPVSLARTIGVCSRARRRSTFTSDQGVVSSVRKLELRAAGAAAGRWHGRARRSPP
jgi:hypothetical protein